jgi:hypothetical protein
MIKMIDQNERQVFVSKYDVSAPKTQFVLKPLNSFELSRALVKYESNMQAEAMFDTIKSCLVEVREGDNVVKEITDVFLRGVPLAVIMELHNTIIASNTLLGEDRKN